MSSNDKWIEITVETAREAVEAVCAILYQEGASGVAIDDPMDIISSNSSPKDWDYIDEGLIPEITDEVKVKGYLAESDRVNDTIDRISMAVKRLHSFGLNPGAAKVTVQTVREEDWAHTWKKYYKPLKIGKHIVIKPTWEPYEGGAGDIVVELDPGMAFGTGGHETTSMCIEFLEEYVKEGSTVFDIGCGSGILSIVSSKLGASRVIAVDIDEVAVKVSRENVKVSGVQNIEVKQGNLLDVVEGKADIIAANIIADVIISVAPRITEYLKPGGLFISSGIIRDRAEDVKKALFNNNFDIVKYKELGEWVAIVAALKE